MIFGRDRNFPPPMNLLFTIGHLAPEAGGPSRTLPSLCNTLAAMGHPVELVCGAPGRGQGEPLLPDPKLVRSTVVAPEKRPSILARPALRSAVEERSREFRPSVIHDNGIWSPENHAVALASKNLGLPRVVSVRGMLRPWALARKRLKKTLGWIAYQRRDLRAARCLVATSDDEASEILAMKLGVPVATVPHAVDLRPARAARGATGTRTILFVGRVVPNKGLADLVDAWAAVRPGGWRVRIAGPEEDGHGREIRKRARAAGVEADFEFLGPLKDAEKWSELEHADLFALPTHGENFGLAIAEALAAGVPVLTTRGAPWEEILTRKCGWWVDTGPAAVTEALRDAVRKSPQELQAMGRRGQDLVGERHGWRDVAAKMILVYAWVAGLGPRPDGLIRSS